MSTVLVISAAKVKELTGKSGNIDERKLTPAIKRSMLELKHGIGTTGYDALIAAITADDTLATESDLKTLRETYIWPWMAWRVMEVSTLALFAEADRNVTAIRNGDDYSSVDAKTLGMLRAEASDYATTYKKELYDFLDDDGGSTYTWYSPTGEEKDAQQRYIGGVITRRPDYSFPYGERGYPVDGYPDQCCDDN